MPENRPMLEGYENAAMLLEAYLWTHDREYRRRFLAYAQKQYHGISNPEELRRRGLKSDWFYDPMAEYMRAVVGVELVVSLDDRGF